MDLALHSSNPGPFARFFALLKMTRFVITVCGMSGGHRRFPRAKLRTTKSPTEKSVGIGMLSGMFEGRKRPSIPIFGMFGQRVEC